MQWDISQIGEWQSIFFWPALRILALFGSAPILSERSVPSQVKIGLALLFTFLIGPTLPPVTVPLMTMAGFWLGLQQVLIGIAIGLTLQFIFGAVRLAGEIIGMQMGLSFAMFFDPVGGANMPMMARIMNTLLILLFLTFNGHLWMLSSVADSFQTLPISTTPLNGSGFMALARTASIVFSSGLMLGLPVITILLTINLALGLLNRLTPQLSIFVIGFPVTLMVGMVTMMLVMHTLSPFSEHLFMDVFTKVNEVINNIAG
ncbi:flagellar biosynthetic protein FliR [Apirhabdus apintestini]|uniref:flagellar biosynthetic protein FliR n=1 Tax=Erwinia sp. HR93 TaxID=3094840 RepID=UPI002ADEBCF9|nr:flagellar biosynthetic protein FliR [Erwinia sp. HR93]MEA1063459.1 flagellar biosynthetic protein FliR [Erwinia sp. HR93]WPM85287.1 flagellar biosynthetic protein FliR [Enterobacteriaceae bacterium CA-0114]